MRAIVVHHGVMCSGRRSGLRAECAGGDQKKGDGAAISMHRVYFEVADLRH